MVLGFSNNDDPIRKTVDYMTACLSGERKMDNSWEKTHNWPLFTQLMLSSWIKIYEPDNELALAFAYRWADVIEKAFADGKYNHDDYVNTYVAQFESKPRGGREIDFSAFYQISLLKGVLASRTESLLLDYLLSRPNGIYYVYPKRLNKPPDVFASKNASWYLAALDILSGYDLSKDKLSFAVDWINKNRDESGQWDLGAKANDGVYFPLSDSWKSVKDRKADCTDRITNLLQKLSA